MADGDGPGISDLIAFGVSLASCLVIGFGLGWLVDIPLGTFPVFALVGLLVGIVAAAAMAYRLMKKLL